MNNEGLIPDNWFPEKETYAPSIEEINNVHTEIVSELFPQQEVLNQFPNIEFSLEYTGQNTWPSIRIGSEDKSGERQIEIFLRNTIQPAKVLAYAINRQGETTPIENATDSEDKIQFQNRLQGVKSSISAARKRNILAKYPSSKHTSLS